VEGRRRIGRWYGEYGRERAPGVRFPHAGLAGCSSDPFAVSPGLCCERAARYRRRQGEGHAGESVADRLDD